MEVRTITFREAVEAFDALIPDHPSDSVLHWWDVHWRVSALYNATLIEQGKTDERLQFVGVTVNGQTFPFLTFNDYFDPSKICLLQPLDNVLAVHKKYVQGLKGVGYDVKVSEFRTVTADPALMMIAPESDRFRRYIKENVPSFASRAIGNFFGERAKTVRWTTLDHYDPLMYMDTVELMVPNMLRLHQNFQDCPTALARIDSAARDWVADWRERVEYVCAVDQDTQRIIALLTVLTIEREASARMILFSPDEKYKGHSMALSAHLQLIRSHLLSGRVDRIDFGLNFDESGNYKDAIKNVRQPLYNFPSFDSHDHMWAWFQDRGFNVQR